MYKKIKNGSFMNWIWFIIAIMPILLLIIYSLSNLLINKASVKIDNILNYSEQYQETYVDNNLQYEKYYNPYFKSYYYLTDYGDNQLHNENNVLEVEVYQEEITEHNEYIYFDNNYPQKYYIYLYIEGEYYDNQNYLELCTQDNVIYNLESNIIYEFYIDDSGGNGTPYFDLHIDNKIWCNLKIFICEDKIQKDLFNGLNNWNYILIDNNKITLYDYLTDFNETIQTNGFISNAFLNLSQFFGVTNVYYSLACYYIEYLLVIVLLHLAFDVLYILPNVCHKFMEKIGGERD